MILKEEMQCLENWLAHQAIIVGEVVSFGEELTSWDEARRNITSRLIRTSGLKS